MLTTSYMVPLDKEEEEQLVFPNVSITQREIEIIRYLAQGMSGKEIAMELKISHRTVDAHKQKLMHKLGTRKSTEIVAIAYKMKWI